MQSHSTLPFFKIFSSVLCLLVEYPDRHRGLQIWANQSLIKFSTHFFSRNLALSLDVTLQKHFNHNLGLSELYQCDQGMLATK